MKNVRIALSAIAVVAVLGGAFAFKAHKSAVSIYQCVSNQCTFFETVAATSTTQKTGYTELQNTGIQSTGLSCAADKCNTPLWILGE
jgi:hypothetical protein